MFDKIDQIFYINLDKRTDRREEIENELNRLELQYERFPAIEHSLGIAGCGLSHMTVLKIAKERGYKNVLIFEDDFAFWVSKNEFQEKIDLLFSVNPGFDVCMFTYSHEIVEDISDVTCLKKVKFASNAACYLVNNHYYDAIINLYEHNMPLLIQTEAHWKYSNDQIWRELQEKDNWYCSSQIMGQQRDGFSNCANNIVIYSKTTTEK